MSLCLRWPRSHPNGCFTTSTRPVASCKVVARSNFNTGAIITTSIPAGDLTIGLLGEGDVQAAGLLLTRAFAGTPEAVKLDEALKYMAARLLSGSTGSGLTLVARLVPADASLLPPGKSSRMVGTVSLSFDANSRDAFETLVPPTNEVYLANMAVEPKFRRQRIARMMLAACDAAVQSRGQESIWLHVRQADDAAQTLYAGYGYQEVERDKPKLGLFGFGNSSNPRPRILMRRQLSG